MVRSLSPIQTLPTMRFYYYICMIVLILNSMEQKSLVIKYEEFASTCELAAEERELVEAAIEARKGSYAPYSQYHVGAAVRLEDGQIVCGSNQENAAYPSSLCAERTAMFAASAQHPGKKFRAIAVVCGPGEDVQDKPGYPCGACLQVMAQYERESGKKLRILLAGKKLIQAFTGVESLMPFIFQDL